MHLVRAFNFPPAFPIMLRGPLIAQDGLPDRNYSMIHSLVSTASRHRNRFVNAELQASLDSTSTGTPIEPRRPWAGLACVLLTGFVVRVTGLGTHAYWQDEVLNLLQAEHLKAVFLHGELASNHMPLFAALVALWRWAGLDANEWLMRSLPMVLGLAAVAALYCCGRWMFGHRAGLCAAFLLAISPFHTFHSQDLKDYVLISCTAIVSAATLYRAAVRNRLRDWVWYGVAAAATCYSSMFAAPLLVAINLWFLSQVVGHSSEERRRLLRRWFAANCAAALLFVPYLHVSLRQARQTMVEAEHYWLRKPTLWSIAFYLKTVAFGYSDRDPLFKIAMLFFAGFSLSGLWLSWRGNPRATRLLVLWFALPTATTYLLSIPFQSIFLIRAQLPYAMPVFLWMGLALSRIKRPRIRRICAAGFVVLAAVPLWDVYQGRFPLQEYPHRPGVHPPYQYREAARLILDSWQEGDIIVHSSSRLWFPFYWYGMRGAPQYTVSTSPEFVRRFLLGNPRATHQPQFENWFMRLLQPLAPETGRVWFVCSEWEREYIPGNVPFVWRWLDSHYVELEHHTFYDFEVFLYARELDGIPIEVVRRDQDDGVAALMTYRGGWSGTYKKVKPDFGLVSSPPEARRGPLLLRFEDSSEDALDPDAGVVRFRIENRSSEDVPCRVMCLFSDTLTDLVSLEETEPESEAWRIAEMHNDCPPPDSYDVSVWKGSATASDSAHLAGHVRVPRGRYIFHLYAYMGDRNSEAACVPVRLWIDNMPLPFAQLPELDAGPDKWVWYGSGSVTIDLTEDTVPIRLTAFSQDDQPEQEISVAYLAWNKTFENGDAGMTAAACPSPRQEKLLIPKNTSRSCAFDIASDARRVDIWVFEQTETGYAYRIFAPIRSVHRDGHGLNQTGTNRTSLCAQDHVSLD